MIKSTNPISAATMLVKLAEFEILKPLLELSEEEVLIYEKKSLYLQKTPESALHNYGR